MLVAVALLLASTLSDPLTPEEIWSTQLAIYHSTIIDCDGACKAPIDATLDRPHIPLEVTSSDSPDWIKNDPIDHRPGSARGLSADNRGPQSTVANAPLRVMLADFHRPLHLQAPVNMLGDTNIPTGTTVTFSSQGDAALNALTGKGLTDFQIIVGTMCRWTAGPSFSFGLVTQLANSIGIQTISKGTGTAIVQRRVSLNWHTLWPFLIKEGSLVALDVMTAGVFGTVGRGVLFTTVLAHEGADHIPAVFGRGAPNPDPYLNGSTGAADRIDLVPGECKEAQFSGVYGGPNTNFVTDRLQLLP